MVVLPSKRLLLVAFFLLCFVSITAKARSLPKESSSHGGEKGDQNDPLTVTQSINMQPHSHEDLETMDYTPARKKPPIHN
ncbi:Ankyrin repeat domain-containing protein [Actinidia chinensis var. chinensis]|uniref:Ankyrin repeat domain-containing protein n=1 Tax=Actinidia chinensis var. chinensis TaxID=1590841 RepID=A0A2R6S373_ACTCC|nr:Ankyrin repeat domain-containing protein [Actinidia chinensis var. chinensis]